MQIPKWLGKGCVCKLFIKLQSTPASYMNSFLAEVAELSPQLFLIPKLDDWNKIRTVAFLVPINSYPEETTKRDRQLAWILALILWLPTGSFDQDDSGGLTAEEVGMITNLNMLVDSFFCWSFFCWKKDFKKMANGWETLNEKMKRPWIGLAAWSSNWLPTLNFTRWRKPSTWRGRSSSWKCNESLKRFPRQKVPVVGGNIR